MRFPGACVVASVLVLGLPACARPGRVGAVAIQSGPVIEIERTPRPSGERGPDVSAGEARRPSDLPATTYHAGTAALTTADGRTARVDLLMVRARAADARATEERWFQAAEPLVRCAEYTRVLLREGDHLTVTESQTGLTGEGVQEAEARWSWHGTMRSGTRVTSTVEVTGSGELHIVNKGFDASGRPMAETSVTYLPMTREAYERRREAFVRRCASQTQP